MQISYIFKGYAGDSDFGTKIAVIGVYHVINQTFIELKELLLEVAEGLQLEHYDVVWIDNVLVDRGIKRKINMVTFVIGKNPGL